MSLSKWIIIVLVILVVVHFSSIGFLSTFSMFILWVSIKRLNHNLAAVRIDPVVVVDVVLEGVAENPPL